MTWGIFKHVCLSCAAVGTRVPDALLVSLAIRHDATFVSADRGLAGFEGLRCRFVGE